MNSFLNLINPFLIKNSFDKYTDSSAFANYQKIAKDYYKLFNKFQKKLSSIQGVQLYKKVKSWFFNLSLESRLKICTVENELFCNIIYQMYLRTKYDKSIQFIPKTDLTEIYELQPQNIYKDFIEETCSFEFSIDNYFACRGDTISSYIDNYSMMEDGIYGLNSKDKKNNSNIIDFITNNIKFYSVHYKPYPDCFCLSPCFLLNEDNFESHFIYYGNSNYFKNLIQPFYNQEKDVYGYLLPDWFNCCDSKNVEIKLFITRYIFAFIEQAIMVKYLLNNYFINKKPGNKNKENESIFSLINDYNLNRIFVDRKTVINYFNLNYNESNMKKKLFNEIGLEKIFENILRNNEINNKIIFYKNFRRNYNYSGSRGAMLVQPLLDINSNNNYIYNTFYDDMRLFFHNNQIEQSNYVLNVIRQNIMKVIESSDNVTFTDFLLFQNVVNLWEYDYFIQNEIVEYFINLFNEQNYKDLLEEEKETTKKKKKRKKKKNKGVNDDEIKNNNNTNDNKNEINNDNKNKNNNFINIDLECYKELFKDEDKVLYGPYYLSVNLDLKKKFQNLKDNKLKSIAKKNKKQDIKEIYNFIKYDFLLNYIINKVIILQPDNYVKFFDNNEIKINKPEEKNTSKIKGLKLIKKNKKKSDEDLDLITINFNINDKNEENEIILNENKNEEELINKGQRTNGNNNKNEIKNNIITNKDEDIHTNKTILNDNKNEISEDVTNNNIIKKENNIQLNPLQLPKNKNIRSNSNNSRNKSTERKKQKKENIFFLFDTVKAKPKNKNKSKSPNAPKKQKNIQNKLNIKITKINSDNYNLSFYEKLHNSILKNEKKVNIILQHLTKFKNYCIDEIKQMINKTYETNSINYFIDLYGSYTTDLMIEASDIDIKIKLYNIKKDEFDKYFMDLYQYLNSEKKFEKIIPISTASVPVIKLIIDIEKFLTKEDLKNEFLQLKQENFFKNYIFDKNELIQIRVDITFIVNYQNKVFDNNNEIMNKIENDKIIIDNKENNEKSNVIYIKEQLDIFPEIKPILILLKRYFYVKNMNSSFEGGLSSYNLFLLILSFAKYNNFSKNKIINLGYFLIQFLEFFGKIFDFKNFTVNVNSPYIYEANSFNNYNSGKSLTILDPLTGLNASKSSYRIFEIQNMFLNAYDFFEKEKIKYENEVYKNESNDKRNNDKSQQFEGILGLTKIHKNEYSKKNNKDKTFINIIDRFFFS